MLYESKSYTTSLRRNMHNYSQKDFDWELSLDKKELPDPQEFHKPDVQLGGLVPIPKVGIGRLDFPINLLLRDGSHQNVLSSVSAYVNMPSVEQRGINMSRLARCFYDTLAGRSGIDLLEFYEIVENYRKVLPSDDAYLKVRFDLPLLKKALREDHQGWIRYPIELEIINKSGQVKSYLTVQYRYASACPCSYALSKHSRDVFDTPSISHSQPSTAWIKIEFDPADRVWIEDIIDMAREAQPSELLPGVVTRVGEFSFAQLIASKGVTGFVEDVIRRFYAVLNGNPKVLDFAVNIEHYESLNQNIAIAVIFKGIPGGLT
jgi:GTP cyclohydrolase I